METDDRVLSIFPLHVVLFPYMTLPLHVFEDRYKQMVAACLDSDRTFGVAFIRAGPEVGGPAEPYEIGTTAFITDVKPLPEGRMELKTVGQRRFRILEITQVRPYLVARVELLEEDFDPPALVTVLDAAQELARVCLRRALALNNEWVRRITLPREPDRLSFEVASRLTADLATKQRLLETPTVAERLRLEVPLLQQELERLDRQLLLRQWSHSETLN